MIKQLNDYSSFPTFPSPWTVRDGGIYAANGLFVRAPGSNYLGYTNIPSTKAQATLRAKQVKARGERLWRMHKIDKMLIDNWESHSVRLQWQLDACQKQGIPVTIEFNSEFISNKDIASGGYSQFKTFLKLLGSLNLSNVVMASPLNEFELNQAQYDGACAMIRDFGKYEGILFSSNAVVDQMHTDRKVATGDLADCHIYCGHEGQPRNTFMEIRYKDQSWNHPKAQTLPVIATETGHLAPSSTRFESERDIYKVLLGINAQVICAFAYASAESHWSSQVQPIDMYGYHNDIQRLEAFEWLVNKMAGKEFIPWTQTKGFDVEAIGNDRFVVKPTVTSTFHN